MSAIQSIYDTWANLYRSGDEPTKKIAKANMDALKAHPAGSEIVDDRDIKDDDSPPCEDNPPSHKSTPPGFDKPRKEKTTREVGESLKYQQGHLSVGALDGYKDELMSRAKDQKGRDAVNDWIEKAKHGKLTDADIEKMNKTLAPTHGRAN